MRSAHTVQYSNTTAGLQTDESISGIPDNHLDSRDCHMRFRCLLFERNVEINSFLCFVLIPEETFFSKVKPFFGSSQSRETVPLIFNISLWHFSPRSNHFLLSSVSWDSPFNHQHFSLWPGGKDDPVDEPEEEEVDGAEQQDLLHVPVHRLIRKTTSRLLL